MDHIFHLALYLKSAYYQEVKLNNYINRDLLYFLLNLNYYELFFCRIWKKNLLLFLFFLLGEYDKNLIVEDLYLYLNLMIGCLLLYLYYLSYEKNFDKYFLILYLLNHLGLH